jgi:hypothetical protein
MTLHALITAIQKARDQTKEILRGLEQTGHPQTAESSSVYLALVMIQKRLASMHAGAPLGEFVAEVGQLAAMCTGKLAPLKPLLDDAERIARGG